MKAFILGLLILAACHSSDPTFMGVCEADGQVYVPAGNDVDSRVCADPARITWPSLPLVVDMDEDIAASYASSLGEAIKLWNSELDMAAFTTDGVSAQVHVVIGSASSGANGVTSFTRVDGQLEALVELRQPGDITEAYYILSHELGHVLGLCHDPDDYMSVMYPELDYVWDAPADENGNGADFRTIVVTDNDRSALRAAYGR